MKRTKEEALETREAIIDASLKIFLQKGYANSTLQDIAKCAKMTRGALYWHFKGKEDIYYELYKREHQYIMNLIVDVINTDFPPFEKLKILMKSIILNLYDNQRFSDYIELTWFKTESAFFGSINNRKAATNDFVISEIEKIISDAIKSKHISNRYSAKQIAKTLVIFTNGIYRLKFTTHHIYHDANESISIIYNYLDSIKYYENDK